ncbi:hypothetical protein [Streptomyces cyaneofuscatus]
MLFLELVDNWLLTAAASRDRHLVHTDWRCRPVTWCCCGTARPL